MEIEFTTKEIKRKYDESASKYAAIEHVQEFLGVRKLRRRLLRRASGEVLEVACGTGANFRYYPQECVIIELTYEDGFYAAYTYQW